MDQYYSDRLFASGLEQCYRIAPPRVRRYLEAEIEFVRKNLPARGLILELGCGYGRVLKCLFPRTGIILGIDTSFESLKMAQQKLADERDLFLIRMDAACLALDSNILDTVICIQNGISAFHVDQHHLIEESCRVTRPGGIVLFSSYAPEFWPHRLKWFELQSRAGLIGPIDYQATGDGVIVCRDGFTATTVGPDDFARLTRDIDGDIEIHTVDNSSLFCKITKK